MSGSPSTPNLKDIKEAAGSNTTLYRVLKRLLERQYKFEQTLGISADQIGTSQPAVFAAPDPATFQVTGSSGAFFIQITNPDGVDVPLVHQIQSSQTLPFEASKTIVDYGETNQMLVTIVAPNQSLFWRLRSKYPMGSFNGWQVFQGSSGQGTGSSTNPVPGNPPVSGGGGTPGKDGKDSIPILLPNKPFQGQAAPIGAPASATPSSTNTGTGTVAFASAHGWITGTRVTVSASGGGLATGTIYYLGIPSTTTAQFYTTVAAAQAGTSPITLTANITATLNPNGVAVATIPSTAFAAALATFRNEGTASNWLVSFATVPTTTSYSAKLGPGNSGLATLGEAYTHEMPPIGDILILNDGPSASGAGVLAWFACYNDGTSPLAGPTGPAGSTWYTGSGVPSGALGANGDFYLNTATSDVYNKVAGAWLLVANIKGATGATGATGAAGPGYTATSTTSLVTAGTGSKSFTTQSGLAYTVGARIRATSAGTGEFMEGVVTSYSGTTLVATMDLNSGTGTHADWNINLAGQQGQTGATGPTGSGGFVQFQQVQLTGGDISTASTSFVDLTGATITLSTGNHRCLVIFQATCAGSGNFTIEIDLAIDGTRQGQTLGLILIGPGASGTWNENACFSFITPQLSAASHTIKIQWKVSGSTGTIRASTSVAPCTLQVAEMGI